MNHVLLLLRRCVAIGASLLFSVALSAQTSVTLSSTTVGAADNSTPFFGAKSDVVEIPAGKQLTFKFTNNSGATENWHNWLLAVVNTKARDVAENSEYQRVFCPAPRQLCLWW